MQPTQADAVAAASALNDTLKFQKDCLDRQVQALTKVALCLQTLERDDDNREVAEVVFVPLDPCDGLVAATAEFVMAHADGLAGQSAGMASAIAHNQRLIESMQSNIVVPGLHQKLRKM